MMTKMICLFNDEKREIKESFSFVGLNREPITLNFSIFKAHFHPEPSLLNYLIEIIKRIRDSFCN